MRSAVCLLCLLPALAPAAGPPATAGLKVPDGFTVSEFASDDLCHDTWMMTVDAKGRVFVAGKGYIRRLDDTDGDGKADRAVPFADGPADGVMGLLWEGDTLYATGGGGLLRYRDADGDGKADGPPEMIRRMKTGGEHAAHAIRRGPDGWLYVLCGNNTGIDRTFAEGKSPVREPVAGAVLRFSPDFKVCEVVADGFRNPYDMDFATDGELFTFDSDNERCLGLPWYEFTRFYHVAPGGFHGWLAPQKAAFYRLPPYHPDVVAPVATLGRGSPTGVACYRHTQFPEAYRGGFFAADWTFGRVWFLSLKAAGSSFRARPEPFIEAVGESGFAPVALCVQPTTGDLFVAIGGRGTRGGVYRVRHTDAAPGAGSTPVQPGTLEWKSDRAREVVEQAAGGGAGSLRAWELCRRHLDKLTDDQVGRLCLAGSTSSDPGVRRACLRFHADAETAGRKPVAAKTSDGQRLTLRLRAGTRPGTVANAAPELLGREPAARLECLAAFQAAVGGRDTSAKVTGTVWEGYTAGKPGAESDGIAQAFGRLWREFPSGDADVDRELTRTAAMIQSDRPEVFAGVLDRLSADSPPVDDVHHLIVLARLAAPRDEKARGRIAAALLALDRKYVRSGVQRDRHWPLRVGEAYAELCRRDPALAAAVVGHADFGRPEHTLFAGPERKRAAERFAAKAADANFEWTPGVAELIATLPPATSLPLLRKQWDNQAVRDAVLTALARNPAEEDRDRFVAGLGSTTPAVVTACLGALEKLPPAADARSLAAAVRAQRNLPDAKESATLRGRFDALLRRATGESHAGPAAWAEWFAAKYPKDAALVAGADGVDVAAWRKRLAALDWPAGDTERGRRVFQKAACASCHSGARAVGPDLAGVAGRFSRDDLFTAILQPSLEVPARYRATQVATTAGRTYLGLIVYEAVDGVILQTGPDAVVRVAGGDIESRQTVTRSLMPAGLLDMASDRDLADLYAYLRSLKGSGPPAAGGP